MNTLRFTPAALRTREEMQDFVTAASAAISEKWRIERNRLQLEYAAAVAAADRDEAAEQVALHNDLIRIAQEAGIDPDTVRYRPAGAFVRHAAGAAAMTAPKPAPAKPVERHPVLRGMRYRQPNREVERAITALEAIAGALEHIDPQSLDSGCRAQWASELQSVASAVARFAKAISNDRNQGELQ